MTQAVSTYKILVVEDDAAERSAMQRLLTEAGYQVATADSADKAMSYLDEVIAFVITDLQMGDVSGIDLLRHWKLKQPDTMFLVVTGHGSLNTAIESIREGAYHYITKPLDPQGLLIMLKNMVRQREETRKVRQLQDRLDERFGLSNIIGHSAGMQRVFDLIKRSAQVLSTVLILGESGTGKELVAQAIHQNSPRRDGPFVAVNCAAMPASLVESELFGHERGSFTGAVERRIGRFESANGGTLFIDEIGDFDITMQVKLLRVLESRTFTSVGGNKEIAVDTRVLAATSRDIRDMMRKGTFREDLYYRLNVITIELPPLRQRLDDIPLLVKRFMDRVNERNHTRVTGISPSFVDALQQYSWPGNVRELLNVIEGTMVLADKTTLEAEDVPHSIRQGLAIRHAAAGGGGVAAAAGAAPPSTEAALNELMSAMTLDDLERRAIAAALQRYNHNRTRAAQALGISVRTLQRKLGAKGVPEAPHPGGSTEAKAAPEEIAAPS